MNMQAKRGSAGHAGRRALQAAALCALLGMTASANAGGYPVWDIASWVQDKVEFLQDKWRWIEQQTQWTKELENYKKQFDSMVSNIQSMQSIMGLPQGAPLQEVPENYMVEERCGKSSNGNGIGGLVGRLTSFQVNGDLYQQRYDICARTQTMRNKQYNEMVRFMTQNTREMATALDKAAREATGRNEPGEMDGAMAGMKATSDRVQQRYQDFEARMDGYDTYIAMSEGENTTLTKNALRGKQGLITKAVTTAVMAKQLCGGNKCSN